MTNSYQLCKIFSGEKDYRENGDYDEYFEANEELAREVIEDSEKFVLKIREILEKEIKN